MKVRDIMHTEVVTLRPTDTLDVADDIMALGRIRHLPVVDESQKLIGLVSRKDVVRASVTSVLHWGPSKEHHWLGTIPVGEVMTKVVTAINPDRDLIEAIDKMVGGKFGCLPVVENGVLVGLITETDCLLALRSLLKPETASS